MEISRYDLLITDPGGGHIVPPGGLKTLILWLAGHGFAKPVAEAVAQEWVEVYLEPGESAHGLFVEGTAPDTAVFHEMAIWTGPTESLAYGGIDARIYVEIRGCMYDHLLGELRRQVATLLHINPVVYQRDHSTLPPHREVPEDEKLVKPKKSMPTRGIVGTRVEEF